MNPAICTLFEGDYHFGIGALVNSLYFHGFRGVVWAGYRRDLPPWARSTKRTPEFDEFLVADGCSIRFVALDTTFHLTNYKPSFMLEILNKYSLDSDALFYFDPDIVVKCRWSFFEDWVNYGIALCEDVNSPVPAAHPLRMAWRQFYANYGITLNSRWEAYFNGGFIGIARSRQEFLRDWFEILNLMAPEVGGLNNWNVRDRTFLFCKTDQDALNIAVMCSKLPFSPMGKEGMDIIPGGYTMSHALGSRKPWRRRMITEALRGYPPSLADKNYWVNCQTPIQLYSPTCLLRKRLALKCASAIGHLL